MALSCEKCGGLRQYLKPTVVLRDGVALLEVEKTPPRDDPAPRFHPDCYDQARNADPSLPLVTI